MATGSTEDLPPGPFAERLRARTEERARDERKALWPDQVYVDAVWDSPRLTSTQKIAALCYGGHARNHPDRDRAWVVYRRLMSQTGIRSRETVAKVIAGLVNLGWLEPAGFRKRHRQVPVFRLSLPADTGTEIRTGTETGTGPDGGHETGTAAGRTSTDIRDEPVRISTQPVRQPHRTSAESGTRLSLREDPHRDSRGELSGRADASGLRPAPPDQDQDPRRGADAEQALADLKANLAGRPRPNLSHWRVGAAPIGDPNPAYDPIALTARMAEDEAARVGEGELTP